ncbi:MAG TPA: prepilin peptidase [Blastocatellia bacterium]|jgi:leader peptidase (prepilin peptidase)/N-methyltransferase|nr:prepilin peptidase [Blastocatellia bacterium]
MEHLPSYFEAFWIFIFGLIIGSFLNVVIHRVPRRESIVLPDSHCPECNTRIRPYDNIPVLSYLILGGRCRSCGVRISPIYPAVELLVAVLYLLVFFKDGLSVRLIADLIFVSLIVPLVFIDLRHKLLPNVITYPGFVVVLILRVIAPDPLIINTTRSLFRLETWPIWWVALLGSLLGAVAGGGTLWLIRELYYRFRHIEGMGLGDVKMMLMVGAFLGWQMALVTIFIASLAGSLIGILAIWLRGGTLRMELQFGVFLGPASIIALFTGEELIRRYASLYG